MKNNYANKKNICAVLTTYRPKEELRQAVEQVSKQVGFVIIVDDGELDENVMRLDRWFNGIKNIYVHHNIMNVGIAASLNTGISIAIGKGFGWILTLDDDSNIKSDYVDRLICGMENIKLKKPIGVIGMSWQESKHLDNRSLEPSRLSFSEKRGIITSGSLFSVESYNEVGQFREEFYIDSVDYDFCLRARRKGLAVVKLDEIGFEHSLGDQRIMNIFGLTIRTESHEPFRIYYEFRNLTVLALEYILVDPFYSFAVIIRHVKILSILLLFDSNKKEKLLNALKGLKDGFKKKLGKMDGFGGK